MRNTLALAALAFCALAFLAGCGSGGSSPATPTPPTITGRALFLDDFGEGFSTVNWSYARNYATPVIDPQHGNPAPSLQLPTSANAPNVAVGGAVHLSAPNPSLGADAMFGVGNGLTMSVDIGFPVAPAPTAEEETVLFVGTGDYIVEFDISPRTVTYFVEKAPLDAQPTTLAQQSVPNDMAWHRYAVQLLPSGMVNLLRDGRSQVTVNVAPLTGANFSLTDLAFLPDGSVAPSSARFDNVAVTQP